MIFTTCAAPPKCSLNIPRVSDINAFGKFGNLFANYLSRPSFCPQKRSVREPACMRTNNSYPRNGSAAIIYAAIAARPPEAIAIYSFDYPLVQSVIMGLIILTKLLVDSCTANGANFNPNSQQLTLAIITTPCMLSLFMIVVVVSVQGVSSLRISRTSQKRIVKGSPRTRHQKSSYMHTHLYHI